jgi:hypothetical protein
VFYLFDHCSLPRLAEKCSSLFREERKLCVPRFTSPVSSFSGFLGLATILPEDRNVGGIRTRCTFWMHAVPVRKLAQNRTV